MTEETIQALVELGINPATVPKGAVKFLWAQEYRHINEETKRWASTPLNNRALAYEIETEHQRHVGILLRNLHKEKPLSAHLAVVPKEGTYWHNFSPALEHVWKTGVAVLVEGPKDARVLASYGVSQAMAYLGSAPSKAHLETISRYARALVWIPDNEPLDPAVVARRKWVEKAAKAFGLHLRIPKLPVKDPAMLAFEHSDCLQQLLKTVEETSKLLGGGYVGDKVSA